MKRMVLKRIVEVVCDVCGAVCQNYAEIIIDGKRHHACYKYDDNRRLTHDCILRDKLREEMSEVKSA